MTSLITALGLVVAAAGRPGNEPAADAVTLSDGKVVLGLITDSPPRGNLEMVVRRAWAESNLPGLAKRWGEEEKSAVRRARKQRRERLEAWRRERAAAAEPGDRINAWIADELSRLADDDPNSPPLMTVRIGRANVRGVVRRPRPTARLLQLAWKLGFDDAETLRLNALKDSIEARGLRTDRPDPVSIEHLLPIAEEPDSQWLARRAATEVLYDPGLRFLRLQNILVTEPEPGQPPSAASALSALRDVKRVLEGDANDLVQERLREVASRGRVGAVVTEQFLNPDLGGATVQLSLWVREPRGQWAPYGSRSATVRPNELKGDDGKELADDPQVQAVFKAFEGLGLGEIPAEVKRKGLNAGAAVRKALGQARSAFQNDLANLALPVEAQPAKAAKRNAPATK
jgi:hypothetical protein